MPKKNTKGFDIQNIAPEFEPNYNKRWGKWIYNPALRKQFGLKKLSKFVREAIKDIQSRFQGKKAYNLDKRGLQEIEVVYRSYKYIINETHDIKLVKFGLKAFDIIRKSLERKMRQLKQMLKEEEDPDLRGFLNSCARFYVKLLHELYIQKDIKTGSDVEGTLEEFIEKFVGKEE